MVSAFSTGTGSSMRNKVSRIDLIDKISTKPRGGITFSSSQLRSNSDNIGHDAPSSNSVVREEKYKEIMNCS